MQAQYLSFLQARIGELKTALFFCDDQDALPFPAYIITALKTDEEGYVWFSIRNEGNTAVADNASFPAHLEFYRKGHPYTIKIKGAVSVVKDKAIVTGCIKDQPGKNLHIKDKNRSGNLLLKVKIDTADYKELTPPNLFQPVINIGTILKNMVRANHQWQPTVWG